MDVAVPEDAAGEAVAVPEDAVREGVEVPEEVSVPEQTSVSDPEDVGTVVILKAE